MRHPIRLTALLSVLLLLLPLSACAAQSEKVIGTCGSYDLLYEELRFITMSYKQILDATYGDGNDDNGTIWDSPETAERYRAELEEKVLSMLAENNRILALCEAYGITKEIYNGDEIQNAVNAQLKQDIASVGGQDAFDKEMESIYMTENLYRTYLARDLMKYKLREAILNDPACSEDIITDQTAFSDWLADGHCVYVQHIMIRNDEGEDAAMNRLFAEEVSEKLQSGENRIEDFIGNKNFNEDLTNTAPYYLVEGLYDQALTDAGLRLYDVYDASDVIETDNCYYVLQHVPEEDDTLSSQLSDLFDTYLWAKIGAMVNQSDVTQVTLNDYGKSIDLTAMQ